MVTDKAKVAGYLDDEARDALSRYADRNRLTKSSALEKLIKDSLVRDISKTPEAIALYNDYKNRLMELEKKLEKSLLQQRFLVEVNERLDEQLATVQCAIERLNRVASEKLTEYFTDDEVAAYARVRVETVREFRHGIRKPRGSNICSLMENFVADNGKWRKRG